MKTFGCCHLLLLLNSVIANPFYSVRTLVTKHAFSSYVVNEMMNDVVDKQVILHNILSHPKVNFGFELTTLSIVSYIVYKSYYTSISSFYDKFNKVPDYKNYYRKIKFCIFILTIVLTKEIENAI